MCVKALQSRGASGVPSRAMRLALVLTALVAACDATPVPVTNCTPGVQTPCACPGGSSGAQRCNDTGSAFEACMCRDAEPPADVTTDAVVAADGSQLDVPSDGGSDAAGEDVIRPDLDGRCPGTLHACSGRCIALQDQRNCGRCGVSCSDNFVCVPMGIFAECVPPDAGADASD